MMDFHIRRTLGLLMRTIWQCAPVIAIAALTAGCATSTNNTQAYNWPPGNDQTPTHPTSVVHANAVIQGYLLPDSHEKLVSHTRADRRTDDVHIHPDSWGPNGWREMPAAPIHSASITPVAKVADAKAMSAGGDDVMRTYVAPRCDRGHA